MIESRIPREIPTVGVVRRRLSAAVAEARVLRQLLRLAERVEREQTHLRADAESETQRPADPGSPGPEAVELPGGKAVRHAR